MKLASINGVHHAAYRCRDAEQTRWFYEDVLGLELEAAFVFDKVSGTEMEREYMHLFFNLGDGSYIAFFDEPDTATAVQFEQKDSFDQHMAFEIDSLDDLQRWKQRIKEARIKCAGPINHEFVHSIYFYDPNGIQMEITCRDPDYAAIMTEKKSKVKQQMQEWTQRTRAQKEQLFGVEALDSREINKFRI